MRVDEVVPLLHQKLTEAVELRQQHRWFDMLVRREVLVELAAEFNPHLTQNGLTEPVRKCRVHQNEKSMPI